MAQLLKARDPAHPPLGGSSTPSAAAATPKPSRSVRAPSGGSTKKAENAYPRSRDRRLSRKTGAAVGKPPGSANEVSAVNTADNPDEVAVPVGHWEAAGKTASSESRASGRPPSRAASLTP